jgi:hypothetical protein
MAPEPGVKTTAGSLVEYRIECAAGLLLFLLICSLTFTANGMSTAAASPNSERAEPITNASAATTLFMWTLRSSGASGRAAVGRYAPRGL